MRGKEVYKTQELVLVLYQLLQRNTPGGEILFMGACFRGGEIFLFKGGCFSSSLDVSFQNLRGLCAI